MTKTRKLQFYKMGIGELDNYILHKATLYEAEWIWKNIASPDDCYINHQIGTSCYHRLKTLDETLPQKRYSSSLWAQRKVVQNWSNGISLDC
jgi:hypothetical protein